MELKIQKKLASKVLNVGLNKIWFDPLRLEDVEQAITRADILDLIKDKAIRIKAGIRREVKKNRGKRKAGSRKMIVKNRKRKYINRIRKMRGHISEVHKKGEISEELKWKVRGLAKAGQFRSLRHLKEYLKAPSVEKK